MDQDWIKQQYCLALYNPLILISNLDLCVYFAVVFAAQLPAVTNSSSSEDEAGRSPSTVVRRRRLRRNTTSIVTEPEEEEALESGHSEEEDEDEDEDEDEEVKEQEEQAGVRPAAALDVQMQGQGSSILNKCILIALVVAISMGYGHFYGTKFTANWKVLLTLL